MLVSQAEYARHRNVSEAAVNKAWKRGRITKNAEGLIDQEQADRDWEAKTDKRQCRKTKDVRPSPPTTPIASMPAGPEEETTDGDFAEAQRQHEWEKVWKERQARKVRERQLLETAEIQKLLEPVREVIKNRLLLLPSKVPPESRVLVDREVRSLLHEVAELSIDAA